MIRYFAIGLVVGLLALRILRSRWGSRLLSISVRALDVIYLVALGLTGVVAVVTEYWLLLAVVGVLLALRGIEALQNRRRHGPRPDSRVT